MSEILICLVLIAKGLVEETIHEWALRRQLFPDGSEVRDGAGDIAVFDRNGDPVE